MGSKFVDPRTGAELTPSERFSRIAQGVMRRWSFVAFYLVTFILWWSFGRLIGDSSHVALNLTLSIMALVIESTVGIYMFNQTMRDAVILRKLLKMEQHIEELLERESCQSSKDRT